MMPNPTRPTFALLVLSVLLSACGDEGGFQKPRETAGPAPSSSAPVQPPASTAGKLEWDLPAGWTEQPTSPYRQANFRLPGGTKAECYLSFLGGEAGGLAGNIDRWRNQLGLPPLPPAEL